MSEQLPVRGAKHDALRAFLGEWRAEGVSYGGTDQTGNDPKANGVTWASTHVGSWHSGEFFMVQDERAIIGGTGKFDTLSLMGVDPETDGFFTHFRKPRILPSLPGQC